MNSDLERLEQKVQELAERLRRVEAHVFDEDRPVPRAAESRAPDREDAPTTGSPQTTFSATVIISLIGRSMIILGGAFLLRWLTQSGTLPQGVGSVIGMVYALLWITMADIAAGRNQRHSAAFHGVTGAMIALPLLIEVTSKFHFLSPAASSASLALFVILGLVVAGRRRLRVLAWIVAVPAAPTAFVLAGQTGAVTPFLLSLLVLGLVTLWLGYLRRWLALAAVMAIAVDVGLMLLVLDHTKNVEATGVLELSLWEPLLLLIGLIGVYFGSYCFHVFRRKRTITAIEITQALIVFLIGLGGIAIVVNARAHSMLPLGIVCLALSAAGYGAGYGFLPRRDPNRRNFLFFTLLGMAMMLLGCELTVSRPIAAAIFGMVALIAGVVARPIASPVLYLHGAVYLLVAIVRSGLFGTIADGFVGPTLPGKEWIGASIILTFAITIAFPLFLRPDGRAIDVFLGRRGVELLSLIGTLGLLIAIAALVTRFLPLPQGDTYRGALATTRTAALVMSAVALASASRRARYPNLAWPVYAVLGLAAIKIALEDAQVGGFSIMFLAFALYGSALILAPRLLRRSSASQ